MNRQLRKYSILFLALACFAGAKIANVHAFSIQPAIIELEADPGGESEGVLQIFNDEPVARDIVVSIQRFLPLGESGLQQFLPPEERGGLPSWLVLTPNAFRLAPGETRRVPFRVHVPKDAAPGGYYVALFFGTSLTDQANDRIVMGTRTGSLLFFTVHGNARPSLHISDFKQQNERRGAWPQGFGYKIQNVGTVHTIPQGYLAIKNMFGQTSRIILLNAENGRVLPGSTRAFTVSLSESQNTAGGFWAALKNEWKAFGIGRYQAELVWADPSLVTQMAPAVSFIVVPWRLGLVGGLLITILLFVLKEVRHRRRHRP